MAYMSSQLHNGTEASNYIEVRSAIEDSTDHAPSTSTVYYAATEDHSAFGQGTCYRDAEGNSFIIIAQGTVPSVTDPSENQCNEAEFLNIEIRPDHQSQYNIYTQNGPIIEQSSQNSTILSEIQQGTYEESMQAESALPSSGRSAGLTACKVEFIGNSTRKRKLHFKCEICNLKTGLAIEVPDRADVTNFDRLVRTIEQDGKLGLTYQEIDDKLSKVFGKHICGFHAPGYWRQPAESDDQPPILTAEASFCAKTDGVQVKRKFPAQRKSRTKKVVKNGSP